MSVETKLAEFRAKKAKQTQWENSAFNKFRAYFRNKPKGTSGGADQCGAGNDDDKQFGARDVETFKHRQKSDLKESDSAAACENIQVPEEIPQSGLSRWILLACKIALWLCLWALFIELQFGAVFFTISLIAFTYLNTRTGARSDKKLSAYSVFNKDCERIQGTLTAEQMQKNMFGGALAAKS